MNKFHISGIKYNSDKIYSHHYDEIYDLFLKDYYNKKGAMLEIGIFEGASLNMYLELFPNAYIYGIDIGNYSDGDRYKIFKCDQSNEDQLNNVVKSLNKDGKDLFYINDDGSHIPTHQILTFNKLFPLLSPGGIYIIEDIGTSYLKNTECYGYPLDYGYKHEFNIVEVFKDATDSVNLQNIKNPKVQHLNDIGSITFGRSCIIIKKRINDFF